MMRTMYSVVAVGVLLHVAVASATAQQSGGAYDVQQARFVAPEPTLAAPPPVAHPDVVAEPEPESAPAEANTGFAYVDDGAGEWMGYDAQTVCEGYCPRCGGGMIGAACVMGQHQAYFPPMHGYYYFHPYHHTHVQRHQIFARLFGEDPANPYANKLFQMVYEQYEADAAVEQPVVEP